MSVSSFQGPLLFPRTQLSSSPPKPLLLSLIPSCPTVSKVGPGLIYPPLIFLKSSLGLLQYCFCFMFWFCRASLVAQTVKNLSAVKESWVVSLSSVQFSCSVVSNPMDPLVRKIPWKRAWQPTPVFLPGEFHGQRSLGAIVSGIANSWTQLSD